MAGCGTSRSGVGTSGGTVGCGARPGMVVAGGGIGTGGSPVTGGAASTGGPPTMGTPPYSGSAPASPTGAPSTQPAQSPQPSHAGAQAPDEQQGRNGRWMQKLPVQPLISPRLAARPQAAQRARDMAGSFARWLKGHANDLDDSGDVRATRGRPRCGIMPQEAAPGNRRGAQKKAHGRAPVGL